MAKAPVNAPSSDSASLADFEKDLSALEEIVTAMESGNISLEESLKHFENGIRLYRRCQSALAQAEQRVQILANLEDSELQDFHEPD